MQRNKQLEMENAAKRQILRNVFGAQVYRSTLPLEVEALYLDYLIEFETLLAAGQISLSGDLVINPATIVGQNPGLMEKWQRVEEELKKLGMMAMIGKP